MPGVRVFPPLLVIQKKKKKKNTCSKAVSLTVLIQTTEARIPCLIPALLKIAHARVKAEAAVLTLLSPPDTARIFAVMDQLTCQTTSLNLCSSFGDHEFPEASSHVQINTLPSCNSKNAELVGPLVLTEKPSLLAFPVMTVLARPSSARSSRCVYIDFCSTQKQRGFVLTTGKGKV